MKRRNRERVKRWLALVLCLSLVFPSTATFVSATEEPAYTDGLCEHHPEHTAECGYAEAVEGQACSHTHDEACGYSEPIEEIPCTHVHDAFCGYQEAVAEVPCDKGCVDEDGDGTIDHQEGCAYQPAVKEKPCTHQHNENCAYQAASEGSPCTHTHDEACGYKEAVAGSPCTYICAICSGEQDMQPLSENDIVISLANPMGYAGQEYNLLENAAVSPEQDGEGNRLQLRITDLQADLADAIYEWENPVLQVTEEQTVNFTVTYEAYIQAGDGGQASEQILATKKLTFSVYAAGEIGKRLEGDNAYISNAYLTRDDSTESKLAIRTGTAPWDNDDPEADGNDGTDLDNKVRTFDLVGYTAAFETQVRDNAPYAAYETGTVYYEFVIEGAKDKVQFEPESMGWLTAKTEGTYEITEETYEGKTCQVLRGSFLAEPTGGNPSAIGNSYQEVNIAIRVLAMKKGDVVAPKFTFWLEGNSVPDNSLVTGSNTSCGTHGEQEYRTVTAPNVTVTSIPRFNVQLKVAVDAYSYVDTFDFSTGNNDAANKNTGTKQGRVSPYGVTLQIQGKSPSHGLRGCELPDGSDITLDLKLSSVYRTDKGEEKELFDDYPLLLWSIEGNRSSSTQEDGRTINGVTNYAVGVAPYNKSSFYQGCYDGGTWKGTQQGDTISITVSNYQVDLTQLPYANAGTTTNDHSYYNPDNISHYWEIQNACFSAGEIWLVQSFYDSAGKYVAEEEGDGTFVTTVQDVSLKMKGESGTALSEVPDNSNQMTNTDDAVVNTVYLTKRDSISSRIAYLKYNSTNTGDPNNALTSGCLENGKDWVLNEGKLTVSGGFAHYNAEGMNTGVAYDYLIKFDDNFFQPDGTYQEYLNYYSTGKRTLLYGAKPDKSGWNHNGKEPDEADYDEEMMKATADDLVFFSSLEALENADYTCVAVLAECRGIFSPQRTEYLLSVNGTVNPEAESGSVYMCTVAAKGWNKGDVQEAAAKALNKKADELTDDDYNNYVKSDAFPSRAGQDSSDLTYANDYPQAFWTYDYEKVDELRTYQKATYNENGFVSATDGKLYGDSCLVVDYVTQITKNVNQPGTDEGGKKLAYDMDTSQREVDYVLYPTAVRTGSESNTKEINTTIYIEDTLPAGLDYIINSAYYGGTYKFNGGGQAGFVTGGQQLYPEITRHEDGTTTLLFTLENVTVTPEALTQFEPIYYSCLIGTPGVEETDVQNQQQLLNSAKIWSDDELIWEFDAAKGNYAEQKILVSKTRAVSFSKTSDQKIVELGDEMGFTIHHGNNSGSSMEVVDVDFLPHNDDGRGTNITGQVVVSELTIQSHELLQNFKLYYTTDIAKRNTKASDYTASDFKEENGWIEMPVDSVTGAAALPDVTHVIVAVAAVGTLQPNSTLKMHITFEVPDGKPGEYLVNSFGSGEMESNARTYIVNRVLEGVVWLDTDKDGLRGSGETLLDGVKVTLLQKDANGSYTPYLLDGNPVTVETGKQVDVLTGAVSAYDLGNYRFCNLAGGDFAVKFESGSAVQIGTYTVTQPNAGTNDTLDSDAVAKEEDGRLVSASIEGIEMPAAGEITVQTYESRHHDLGLYPAQINIPVEKIWADNNDQDGKRPESITVKLLAGGQDTGETLILNQGNSWQGSFTNLNKYENGTEISYTVEEVPVEGYDTQIAGDAANGYTITNSHTPETVTISGSKTWDDKDNQDGKRPESITIRLYANGTELQDKAQTVTKDKGWAWSFTNLPKYENGSQINYTISEDAVTDYTTKVNNYDVMNSYQPGKTSISVTKSWQDNNNQDGIRPESITVKLLANGEDTNKTLTLSKGNSWAGTFSDLDEYKDGEKIVYTIEEVNINGYDTVITGEASTGYIITNRHTPETVTISGSKTWDDGDNQDGKRPESITIRLYANGTELKDKAQTVTKDNGWAWSFTNLPKYADGSQINYTISEDTVADYTTKVNNYDVTNSYQPGKTSVGVTKSWQDNNNQDGIRPESITVKLLANGEDTNKTLTLSKGNSWTGTFSDLDEYKDGEKIVYTIEEVNVNGYDTVITGEASTGYTITNSHTPETITISGAKTWDDGDNQDGKRPESITIRLYANGTELQDKAQTVTKDKGWVWSFTNLPKYENGSQINYTISEDTVADYTTKVNNYDVTNSYQPGKTSVSVTKSWQDNNNQDGIRPESITVKLLANGEDTNKTLTLSKGNSWAGSFSDLDEYAEGQKIVYTIEELTVEGYDTEITGEASTGYIITNSHTPETITISGSKTWDDADNQDGKRPESITIRLYANGTELRDKVLTVTEEDGWDWSFTNLPKYENGSQINYTISEDAVTDYTTTVNGYDITNSYEPGKTSVSVTKSWQDNNNQDGIRPESITVKLLANGKDTNKTLTLSKGNSWTGTFSDLDQYKDGELIKYTVEEEDFTNANQYETVITGSAETGYVITNSHTPETVSISGSKTWDDGDNQDGKRPESITIRLYANGTELKDKAQTVTEGDGWAWSFTNLPKYENGVQINYTISEDAVTDYTTTVTGYDVTNSYQPGKTSVGVTKSWQDNNNQDGIRPESITVKLLANGKDTGKTLTLSKGNSWAGTFSDLDQYKDGELIKYTVEEEDFTNANQYEKVIAGSAETGYVITNSHTPETISISGSKTWDDGDNQDGKRPESITIRLYANGVELQDKAQTVTKDNGWAWSFTNLPKYENGVQINYTISEDTVADYTTKVNNYDVTNSYQPGKTNVGVTKSWQDNNNQDGIRPESITVKLLANGEDTGKTLTLSKGNSWTGTFSDLDGYKDGELIKYTVEEEDFANANQYETVITGNAGTGYVITNSHTPATTEVSGAKTWDDKDNQDGKRPESITIRLYANGVELKDKVLTVTEDNGWAWSFTNLPKYEKGVQINYTISEDAVADYTTTVNGYDVTNSYTPGKTSVGVTKSWQDNNNQDGIRPESITVKLLANGKDTGKTLTLSKGNSWAGAFSDLDEYKDGELIKYTVEEEDFTNANQYETVIAGNAGTGYVITNSHTPETIDISGSKTWDDKDNQDGKRPESITIRLYANGTELKDKALTVTEEDSWAWSFTGLPKYEKGVQINYTISEDAVADYTTIVNDYDVTNSYQPGKTSVGVTKSWQDNNNQDGIRPESITVKLYADGKDTGKKLVLSQKNTWTGSFTDLDEYADGEKIVYTVEEREVEGYDAVVSGSAETGFVITNSHTPAKPGDAADPDEPQKPEQPGKPEDAKGDTPSTGDPTDQVLWMAILALSGMGLGGILIAMKSKGDRGKEK